MKPSQCLHSKISKGLTNSFLFPLSISLPTGQFKESSPLLLHPALRLGLVNSPSFHRTQVVDQLLNHKQLTSTVSDYTALLMSNS